MNGIPQSIKPGRELKSLDSNTSAAAMRHPVQQPSRGSTGQPVGAPCMGAFRIVGHDRSHRVRPVSLVTSRAVAESPVIASVWGRIVADVGLHRCDVGRSWSKAGGPLSLWRSFSVEVDSATAHST